MWSVELKSVFIRASAVFSMLSSESLVPSVDGGVESFGWVALAASNAESRYLRIEGLRVFLAERGRLCSGDWMRAVDSTDIAEELEELDLELGCDRLDPELKEELEDPL